MTLHTQVVRRVSFYTLGQQDSSFNHQLKDGQVSSYKVAMQSSKIYMEQRNSHAEGSLLGAPC